MFQFPEAKVLSPSINSRRELVLKLKIKPEDYQIEDFERLANMVDTVSFAVVMSEFQEQPIEDDLTNLRRQLVMAKKEYCEVSGSSEEAEKERVYKKYNVASRGDLTKEQLEDEIESYRFEIKQFT